MNKRTFVLDGGDHLSLSAFRYSRIDPPAPSGLEDIRLASIFFEKRERIGLLDYHLQGATQIGKTKEY